MYRAQHPAETVKYLVCVFRKLDTVGLFPVETVEDADLDLGRVSREEGEVGAFAAPGRPEGIWKAFFDIRCVLQMNSSGGPPCPAWLRG